MVEAQGRGTGNVKVAFGSEGQVVGGHAGLERREHEYLLVAVDLKNGAAAVSNVEVLLLVKSNAGGDTHAPRVNGPLAVRCDAIDGPFQPAGHIEHAIPVERQPGRVHEVLQEGQHGTLSVDLVNRHRDLLPAASTEGSEDVAGRVDGGVGDGVKVFRHRNSDRDRNRSADRRARIDRQLAAPDSLGHADDEPVRRAQEQAPYLVPETHERPAAPVFGKAAAPDADLPAWDGGARSHLSNLRLAFGEPHLVCDIAPHVTFRFAARRIRLVPFLPQAHLNINLSTASAAKL